tara:strand:+ start:83 stop:220 length:138 start_codon:yes stop_codon:yes gene_type:complete
MLYNAPLLRRNPCKKRLEISMLDNSSQAWRKVLIAVDLSGPGRYA